MSRQSEQQHHRKLLEWEYTPPFDFIDVTHQYDEPTTP
jgi:hypothetical protein